MSSNGKYKFTGEVKRHVENFGDYLRKRHVDKSTLRQKTNYAGYFLNWCESEHLQAVDSRYSDLLTFVDYCKLSGMGKAQASRVIASVRDY